MEDESRPTEAANWTTSYSDVPNLYITFYDETNKRYYNHTGIETEVCPTHSISNFIVLFIYFFMKFSHIHPVFGCERVNSQWSKV